MIIVKSSLVFLLLSIGWHMATADTCVIGNPTLGCTYTAIPAVSSFLYSITSPASSFCYLKATGLAASATGGTNTKCQSKVPSSRLITVNEVEAAVSLASCKPPGAADITPFAIDAYYDAGTTSWKKISDDTTITPTPTVFSSLSSACGANTQVLVNTGGVSNVYTCAAKSTITNVACWYQPIANPRIDAQWSEWSDFGKCGPCAQANSQGGGKRTRCRLCLAPASGGGVTTCATSTNANPKTYTQYPSLYGFQTECETDDCAGGTFKDICNVCLNMGGQTQYAYSDINELVGFGQDCSLSLASMSKALWSPILGYKATGRQIFACGHIGNDGGIRNKEGCYKYAAATNTWTLSPVAGPSTISHAWQTGVFYDLGGAAGELRFYVMSDTKPESWDTDAPATTWRSWQLDTTNYQAPLKPTCGGGCLLIVKLPVIGDYIYSFGGACTTAVQRYKLASPFGWEVLGDIPGEAIPSTGCAFLPNNNKQIMVTTSTNTIAIWSLFTNSWQTTSTASADISGSDLIVPGSDYTVYAGEGGTNYFSLGKKYTFWINQGQAWTDITTGNGNSGHSSSSYICIPKTDLTGVTIPANCNGF